MPLHLLIVLLALHVNKINDNQAPQVTQAQLPADFICCFQVGYKHGLLRVLELGKPRGIYINGNQGLGRVNNNAAPDFSEIFLS